MFQHNFPFSPFENPQVASYGFDKTVAHFQHCIKKWKAGFALLSGCVALGLLDERLLESSQPLIKDALELLHIALQMQGVESIFEHCDGNAAVFTTFLTKVCRPLMLDNLGERTGNIEERER